MAEATSHRRLYPGQFRLVRLQVVNWGTFCGYKDLPIDERGVLFTGPSGSGKSSLLDAHSVALLPTRDQRFNASADLTTKGAKQGSRATADYVRGAWSETNDDQGQSQIRYLRAGKPTWSAIGATYDNGTGSVTTAVVVKYFTGTETDNAALKTFHQLHDGYFDLTALEAWAARGFDTRWFKNTHAAAYPDGPEAYTRELAKRIGLGTSRTALSLLGKAKALKNVGDLDLFIRDNMLDEPATFAAARSMVEKFEPLDEAYETAKRAHDQAKVLARIPDNWQTYMRARQTVALTDAVIGSALERYLRHIHLEALAREIGRIDASLPALDEQLGRLRQQEPQAQDRFLQLDRQLAAEGAELHELERAKAAAERDVPVRAAAYKIYSGRVTRLNLPSPQDESAFTALRGQIPDLLEAFKADRAALKRPLNEAHADAGGVARTLEAKAEELTVLQSARSLLPPHALKRRQEIAAGAGVPLADLPYAAELIDVAEGQERWRPAAEKVMRGFGLRLLVPEHRKNAVRTFIDTHDMKGIVEYSIVTRTSTHQPRPNPSTLAGKLTVDTAHPCGLWLAAQLARRFDHVCVETARELEPHPVAVTVRGTVKTGGNNYRKDDRPELTRPSSYILGANTAAKRAALEQEVAALEAEKDRADETLAQLDGQDQNLKSMVNAAEVVAEYTTWADLDHWSATRQASELTEQIDQLKAGDLNLQRLERQRDEAKTNWEELVGARRRTQDTIEQDQQRRQHYTDLQETEQRKPHTVSDEQESSYLTDVYSSLEIQAAPDTIDQVRVTLRRELDSRRTAADGDRRVCLGQVRSAIEVFIDRWPDAAPDTSGDAERTGGDFAALQQEIELRRLPQAVSRFQQMISDDMLPTIGILLFEIDKAATDIRSRVDMVNKGLRRVEFNTGTYLQIAIDARPFDSSKQFRHMVDKLMSSAPASRKDPQVALAQFKRVRELLARFTSTDTEAERWRREVLDVRLSYTFYGREENTEQATIHTYRNTATNSGGEQEKLVAFCLAAALSYNLADPDSGGRPRFAPLMLDEAFSKSDEQFSAQALSAFDEFGFQLLVAAPIRMSGVLEPFIGQAILVEKRVVADSARSNAASATFGELAVRRDTELDEAYLASA